jgi:hypothetical protein
MKYYFLVMVMIVLFTLPLSAQVLGTCGSGSDATQPATSETAKTNLVNSPVPLPGQQAIDFKLPAVVGDDIKEIKLSDYDGKWRMLCFFPAAFTFV